MIDYKSPTPATIAEVKRMVCALNDTMNAKKHQALIDNIVGTGASIADVLDAYSHLALACSDDLGIEDAPPNGRAGLVYALLTGKTHAADGGAYDSRSVATPLALSSFDRLASGL